MNFKKNSSLNLFLITLVAFYCGLTNILLIELISYFLLFLYLIRYTKKYWVSIEGIFVIIFSLISIPFLLDSPDLLINHFKQLILTLSIVIFSINLTPLSTRILSIISIINFILVFLQVNFNIILFPDFLFDGNYMKSMYESDNTFRALGILAGSHFSTFFISLSTLSLIYANKESLNLLIKRKITKNNLLLIFILSINFLSLYFSYTYTAFISLVFQLCIIFANKIFLVKLLKNLFKKVKINIRGLRINIVLVSFPIIIIFILLNLKKIEYLVSSFFGIFLDNRGIASLGIITAQLQNIFGFVSDLSIFPTREMAVDTQLSENVQNIFSLDEVVEIGLEIGYLKILYTHGIVIGIYLLTFLFRKLYGIRTFLFFAFFHYAHITSNPLILIIAITASKYAKINSNKMLSQKN